MTAIIKTTNLTYRYSGNTVALEDLNLEVERGSIYGFLGPNGSGKTTMLSLLLGLLEIQTGRVEVLGKELHSDRINILSKVGALIESASLYSHLTAKENLDVYKEIYAVTSGQIVAVLKLVGLENVKRKRVKHFSLGMKQRLAIALALLPNPELLILDEPTNGLDPQGIIELRQLLHKLNKEKGMTIMISSHILPEIEKLVSHVGIILHGRLLFQGPLHELFALKERRSRLVIRTSDNEAAIKVLGRFCPSIEEDTLSMPIQNVFEARAINRLLLDNNIDMDSMQLQGNDLEKLFIELTSDK